MKKTITLLVLLIALVILPFFINHGGEYGGADGEAEALIQVTAPDYEPGSSRCMSRLAERLKVCCSPCKAH
ncbi:hypothetical protein O185_06135 [Photorhabdus temperata J3]|uniref:Uncharacterized protein n=1 Tax=Photorhabdus temperata J3 TaxID=1389415 RepID=U7R1Q0_PHOTE|nr:hypothetical protein O185_06135 [Photorhabdus temperata J3]